MLPVRCFTCNHMIGHLWDAYVDMRETLDGKTSLDKLALSRMCCRRMLLTHVPIINDTMLFAAEDRVLDECNTVFLADTKHKRVVKCA